MSWAAHPSASAMSVKVSHRLLHVTLICLGSLSSFTPFPLTARETTIDAQGDLKFQFTVPGNAAFFRAQAQ